MQQIGYFPLHDIDTTELCAEFWKIYKPNAGIMTHEFGEGYRAFQTAQWALDYQDAWGWYNKKKHSVVINKANELHRELGILFEMWIRKWFKTLPQHISLNLVKANIPVDRHIDHPNRSTTVIINVSETLFYGTTQHFYNGDRQLPFSPVMLFNTQIPHSTPAVSYDRPSIQLPYNMTISDLISIHKSGQLLNIL